MIFSNELVVFLPQALALLLLGTAITNFILACFPSLPVMISFPQSASIVILAFISTEIMLKMKGAALESIYYTVLAFIVVSSLVTAVSFLLIGYLKSSRYLRFIPYPVIGGFLGGIGYLLVKNGLNLLLPDGFHFVGAMQFARLEILFPVISAIIFAVALLYLNRKFSHYLIFPVTMIAAVLIFYATIFFSGISIEEAFENGWLFASLPTGLSLDVLTFEHVKEIDWSLIFRNFESILVITILNLFSITVVISGIEMISKSMIKLDLVFRALGLANILSGLVSCPTVYPATANTLLIHKFGSKSFLVNIFLALELILLLFFKVSFISYMPKSVLAGVLMFLGFSLLIDWLWTRRLTLSYFEYFLIWMITVVISVAGFVMGILFGLLVSVLLFTINYSQIKAVKNIFNGSQHHSKLIRSKPQMDLLTEKGFQILILQLQGFIFFGSVNNILEIISRRISEHQKLNFLILDCRMVSRFDSTASNAFTQLELFINAKGIELVWANLSKSILKRLNKISLSAINRKNHYFLSLDHALEWCENKLLMQEGMAEVMLMHQSIRHQVRNVVSDVTLLDKFITYLERIDLNKGEFLVREGDNFNDIFFIESGHIAAQKRLPGDKVIRLQMMTSGAVVGEIAFYLNVTRSVDLIAETPATVYRLKSESLKKMQKEDPQMLQEFHQSIAKILSERLLEANRMIALLLED